jgi:antitoxin component YwqK of YwqJK toxin-antitoxin module
MFKILLPLFICLMFLSIGAQEKVKKVSFFGGGEGKHTLYNKSRMITQKGTFKYGKLWEGKWFRYDENGFLGCIELYVEGEYIGDAEL